MEDKIVSPYEIVSKEHCQKNINKLSKKMEPIPIILERLENISKHFEEKGIVGKIESHVEKTNGRVRKLETWRSFLLGGWAVISLFFPIMFFYFMSSFKYEVKNIVRDEVSTAIKDNNDKYFEIE